MYSLAFAQFFERAFQDFSRDLKINMTGHWLKLYDNFSKIFSSQNYAVKESVAGIRTLTGGYAEAAACMAKKSAGCGPLSVYGFHRPDASVGPPHSTALENKVDDLSVFLAKVAEDVSVLVKNV